MGWLWYTAGGSAPYIPRHQSQRLAVVTALILLHVRVHMKTIPWKMRIHNLKNSWVIFPRSLYFSWKNRLLFNAFYCFYLFNNKQFISRVRISQKVKGVIIQNHEDEDSGRFSYLHKCNFKDSLAFKRANSCSANVFKRDPKSCSNKISKRSWNCSFPKKPFCVLRVTYFQWVITIFINNYTCNYGLPIVYSLFNVS